MEMGKIYSDVYDESGNQIIDLVQEGGGMWGIALIGYTYILEKAGLRFNSVAGTSAGAINTMCLAAIPEEVYKDGTKSKLLTHIIANHDFSDFIDRKDGLIKWLLKGYIRTKSNFAIKLVGVLTWFIFSTLFYFLFTGIFFPEDGTRSFVADKISHLSLGSLLAMLPFIVAYISIKKHWEAIRIKSRKYSPVIM
ncbi:MAG: patatin-like phospholipase family protein [Bacteroidetes bacterium]|nr:patatin-like phospholipase family protein [Bacteroidota bacterium]